MTDSTNQFLTTSNNTLTCFFCGRDLSTAWQVNYVAEGPICSICLVRMNKEMVKCTCDRCTGRRRTEGLTFYNPKLL